MRNRRWRWICDQAPCPHQASGSSVSLANLTRETKQKNWFVVCNVRAIRQSGRLVWVCFGCPTLITQCQHTNKKRVTSAQHIIRTYIIHIHCWPKSEYLRISLKRLGWHVNYRANIVVAILSYGTEMNWVVFVVICNVHKCKKPVLFYLFEDPCLHRKENFLKILTLSFTFFLLLLYLVQNLIFLTIGFSGKRFANNNMHLLGFNILFVRPTSEFLWKTFFM